MQGKLSQTSFHTILFSIGSLLAMEQTCCEGWSSGCTMAHTLTVGVRKAGTDYK